MTSADSPVLRWQTPPLLQARPGDEPQLTDAQRQELDQLRQQARQEGLQAGREEAVQAHTATIEARLQELNQLLSGLTRPYEELSPIVAEELARLAGKIAHQLVRRELKASPDAIMGVVREAIACLPDERERIKVYLNDQDAELMREMSKMVAQDSNWEIINDPTIERGDCRVNMGTSVVDASLDARVNKIMAEILGGERELDGEL